MKTSAPILLSVLAGIASAQSAISTTDRHAYAAGTLPRDASSLLRIISHTYPSATQASLTWTSVPNRLYRVEHDEDLAGVWTYSTLGTISSGGATTSGTLSGLSVVPRRFFRAVAVLPLP